MNSLTALNDSLFTQKSPALLTVRDDQPIKASVPPPPHPPRPPTAGAPSSPPPPPGITPPPAEIALSPSHSDPFLDHVPLRVEPPARRPPLPPSPRRSPATSAAPSFPTTLTPIAGPANHSLAAPSLPAGPPATLFDALFGSIQPEDSPPASHQSADAPGDSFTGRKESSPPSLPPTLSRHHKHTPPPPAESDLFATSKLDPDGFSDEAAPRHPPALPSATLLRPPERPAAAASKSSTVENALFDDVFTLPATIVTERSSLNASLSVSKTVVRTAASPIAMPSPPPPPLQPTPPVPATSLLPDALFATPNDASSRIGEQEGETVGAATNAISSAASSGVSDAEVLFDLLQQRVR